MRLFEGTEFFQPVRCDQCNELEEECQCPPAIPDAAPPATQTAYVRTEKRKKGKRVTVVRGIHAATPEPHLSELLSQLKTTCGAGGSIQEDRLEIQGEHVERVVNKLKEIGYQVRF